MDQNNIKFALPVGGFSYQITFLNNLGYSKSWSTCRHNHSEIEVQFILSGKCRLLLGSAYAEVKAGDILMIAPFVYHAPIAPGPSEDFEKYSFIFSFTVTDKGGKDADTGENFAFVLTEGKDFVASFTSIGDFRILDDDFGGVDAWLQVVDEFREKPFGYFSRTVSIITGLLVSLSRSLTGGKSMSVESIPRKTLDENRTILLEAFFDYDQLFTRTQKGLAESLGVSCRHLGRILKTTYNKSFREKLLQSRMEVAADLLVNTDWNIASIADRLGYTTEAGFYRLFHHYFQSTPASYRKKMRLR